MYNSSLKGLVLNCKVQIDFRNRQTLNKNTGKEQQIILYTWSPACGTGFCAAQWLFFTQCASYLVALHSTIDLYENKWQTGVLLFLLVIISEKPREDKP